VLSEHFLHSPPAAARSSRYSFGPQVTHLFYCMLAIPLLHFLHSVVEYDTPVILINSISAAKSSILSSPIKFSYF